MYDNCYYFLTPLLNAIEITRIRLIDLYHAKGRYEEKRTTS